MKTDSVCRKLDDVVQVCGSSVVTAICFQFVDKSQQYFFEAK